MTSNPESDIPVRPSSLASAIQISRPFLKIRSMIYTELLAVKRLLCDNDYNDEGTPQTLQATAVHANLATNAKVDGHQQTQAALSLRYSNPQSTIRSP